MYMHPSDDSLYTFVVESGLLSRRDIESVRERAQASGQSLYTHLASSGLLQPDELRKAVASVSGIPFIRLEREDISTDALLHIPEPFARVHNAAAFRQNDEEIEVALLSLDDVPALAQLGHERPLRVRLTDSGSMRKALLYYQGHLKQTVGEAIARAAGAVAEPTSLGEHDLRTLAQGQAASTLVDLLLQHALSCRASDVHIDQTEKGLLVRYRIGGELCEAMLLPTRASSAVLSRLSLLAKTPLVGGAVRLGRFAFESTGGKVSLTFATVPTVRGDRAVLHLTPAHAGRDGFTLEALGFSGQALERTHAALSSRSGLVLVTGEAGSGKTTTLYTLLDLLASPKKNVITVEETIECTIPGIVQTTVNPKLGLTLAAATRAALRQDPDVLMISSVEEADVAGLALAAANRGVLVLAGLEAGSCVEGVATFLERSPSSEICAATLRAVIGVSHVRKLCDEHRMQTLSRIEMRFIEEAADPVRILSTLRDTGAVTTDTMWKDIQVGATEVCSLCEEGFAGRLGVQQVLTPTETLKTLIRERADAATIEEVARQEGMLSLVEDAVCKAALGQTTLEEALSIATSA